MVVYRFGKRNPANDRGWGVVELRTVWWFIELDSRTQLLRGGENNTMV